MKIKNKVFTAMGIIAIVGAVGCTVVYSKEKNDVQANRIVLLKTKENLNRSKKELMKYVNDEGILTIPNGGSREELTQLVNESKKIIESKEVGLEKVMLVPTEDLELISKTNETEINNLNKLVKVVEDINVSEKILNPILNNAEITKESIVGENLSLKPKVTNVEIENAEKKLNSEVKHKKVKIHSLKHIEKAKSLFNNQVEVTKLVKSINLDEVNSELIESIKPKIEGLKDEELKKSLLNELNSIESQYNEKQEVERQAAIAHEEEVASQKQATQVQQTQVNNAQAAPDSQPSPQSTQAQPSAPEAPEAPAAPAPVDTSGFSFNGYSFGLGSFNGAGHVPADNLVYQWADMPSHYLIERAGSAGAVIRSVGVGSQVTIQGRTYTVYAVQSGVANDGSAGEVLYSKQTGDSISFQTCDSNSEWSNLTLWWAR